MGGFGVGKGVALATAVVCLVMLLRLMLGERRRQRFDNACLRWATRIEQGAQRLWHRRADRQAAAQAAQDAIERARRVSAAEVDKDGNVLRPKAFKGPHKPH